MFKQLDLALQKAEMSGAEKLTCIDQWNTWDEYSMWEGSFNALWKSISKQDWNLYLEQLLIQLKVSKNAENRTSLLESVLHGLPFSSIKQTRLELFEAYAEETPLESELIKEWKRQKLHSKLIPFLVNKINTSLRNERHLDLLRDELESSLLAQNRKEEAMAMRRDLFIGKPSLAGYQTLARLSSGSVFKKNVSASALHYLETGNAEGLQKLLAGKSPILANQNLKNMKHILKFPCAELLFEIAVKKRNVNEAVRCYDILIKNTQKMWIPEMDSFVKLIADQYPERALTYWKQKAEGLIAQTNPRAYEDACAYLEKVIRLYTKKKLVIEWQSYEQNLRVEFKRKTTFIKLLDTLVKRLA